MRRRYSTLLKDKVSLIRADLSVVCDEAFSSVISNDVMFIPFRSAEHIQYTLLHIYTFAHIHTVEPPSAASVLHRWPVNSLTGD